MPSIVPVQIVNNFVNVIIAFGLTVLVLGADLGLKVLVHHFVVANNYFESRTVQKEFNSYSEQKKIDIEPLKHAYRAEYKIFWKEFTHFEKQLYSVNSPADKSAKEFATLLHNLCPHMAIRLGPIIQGKRKFRVFNNDSSLMFALTPQKLTPIRMPKWLARKWSPQPYNFVKPPNVAFMSNVELGWIEISSNQSDYVKDWTYAPVDAD